MLAHEVFAKLQAIHGTKWLFLWRGANMVEVQSTWDDALRDVAPARIRAALVDCQTAEAPPTLPQFLALCRAHSAPTDRRPQIEYHGEPTGRDQARENLGRIQRALASVGHGNAAADPLFWAKHPAGAGAVWLMARGAARDYRLREIMLSHLDDAGERCRSDAAAAALLAVFDIPEWREELERRALDRGEAAA